MTTKTKDKAIYRPADAAKQIADKAAGEVAQLQTRLQDLQLKSSQAQEERMQLLNEQARRADHLVDIQQSLTDLERRHKDAVSYASVAQGTLGEQKAVVEVSDLQKQIVPARTHVEEITAQYTKLDATTTTRLIEIDADLERMTRETQEYNARLRDVQNVSFRAIRELGQHTLDEIMTDYQQHLDAIEQAKKAVVDLEVKRQQFLEQAQETLSAWPELAKQLACERPYDDATVRIIRAAINYVELLVRDGANITRSMNVPAVYGFYNWLQILEVSRDELYLNETLGSEKRTLKRHLHNLQTLHDQYVATKR